MKSYVVCRLSGLNLDRLIDRLRQKKYKLKNITKHAKCIVNIEILSKKYNDLIKICNFYNIKCEKIGEYGLKYNSLRLIWRMGVFVGVFLSLFFVIFCSSFIWNVNVTIDGAQTSSLNVECIKEYLSLKGIKIGCKLQNVDEAFIKRDLLSSYEDIQNLTVKKNGVNLDVKFTIKEESQKNQKTAICADKDGILEKLDVFAGISLYKIGSVVKKGDVIVQPDITGICAADVYIKTWVQESEVGFLTKQTLRRTGKKQVKNNMFFGNQVVTTNNNESKFESFEIEEKDIYISHNCFLPIKIKNKTYYELETIEETLSLEELIEDLKESLSEKIKSNLPSGIELDNLRYSVYEEAGSVRVVASSEIVYKLV